MENTAMKTTANQPAQQKSSKVDLKDIMPLAIGGTAFFVGYVLATGRIDFLVKTARHLSNEVGQVFVNAAVEAVQDHFQET